MWTQIFQILKARGLSQRAVAEKIGIDQSTLSRLMDGRAPEPRFSVGIALINLAGGVDELETVHGIPVRAYLCGTESSAAPPPDPCALDAPMKKAA